MLLKESDFKPKEGHCWIAKQVVWNIRFYLMVRNICNLKRKMN